MQAKQTLPSSSRAPVDYQRFGTPSTSVLTGECMRGCSATEGPGPPQGGRSW